MSRKPRQIQSRRDDVYATRYYDSYRVHFPVAQETVFAAMRTLQEPCFDHTMRTCMVGKRWHDQLPAQLERLADAVDQFMGETTPPRPASEPVPVSSVESIEDEALCCA